MHKELRTPVAIVASLLILLISGAVHGQSYSNQKVDVSWPNCSPKTNTEFSSGIVGVTGGRDFTPNPCLAQETTWFSSYALYINTGYPGRSYGVKFASYPLRCIHTNYNCLAYNYGYSAAKYAIDYSLTQNAHASTWWLDVETENSWTLHPRVNRAVLEGAINAIKGVPFVTKIGIYSAPSQWNFLTNSWHNKLPLWIGTGSTSRQVALNACESISFTGGEVLLTQYTKKLDIDIACKIT